MAAKIVAYTPEMIARMTEAYLAAPTKDTVEALATEVGKSAKSIVAKLAQLGIYRKAEKAAAGATKDSKADLAARIAGEDAELAADLVKLTKASLVKLMG
jgi:hypothetical protein